jgi:hypothetical protein
MIFVFGSNCKGVHGGGAARFAHLKKGAVMGIGEGPTGECYALPTVVKIGDAPMPLEEVKSHVDKFIAYAIEHPEYTFQVTRIGCGLAGFTDKQIAPMFVNAPDNCEIDSVWQQWLPAKKVWGTF